MLMLVGYACLTIVPGTVRYTGESIMRKVAMDDHFTSIVCGYCLVERCLLVLN